MKTTSIFILALFPVFLWSCQEDVPIPVEPDPCGAVPLGITKEAIYLIPNYASIPNVDSSWSWTLRQDTLIIKHHSGGFDPGGYIRYLQFVINGCITLVRDYTYVYQFNNTFIDPFTIIIWENELNFELQEWNEQTRMVGRNNDTEIWIDFNEDNRY